MPACKHCGANNRDEDSFCIQCGKPLKGTESSADLLEAGIVCPKCDTYNEPSRKTCLRCGNSLSGLTSMLQAVMPDSEKTVKVSSPLGSQPTQGLGAATVEQEPTEKVSSPLGSRVSTESPATKPDLAAATTLPSSEEVTAKEELPKRDTVRMPAAVAPDVSFGNCPHCQAKLTASAQLCLVCGQRLTEEEPRKELSQDVSIRLRLARGLGREDTTFPIGPSGVTVGRRNGLVNVPEDPYLSPLHFHLKVVGSRLLIEDQHSLNGTFLRIRDKAELRQGTELVAGNQRILLLGLGGPTTDARTPQSTDTRSYGGPIPRQLFVAFRLLHRGAEKKPLSGPVMLRAGPMISLGRSDCDINFPNDPKLAPRHLEFHLLPSGLQVVETGATSGVYIRIRQATHLQNGDEIMAGEEIFRVEIG